MVLAEGGRRWHRSGQVIGVEHQQWRQVIIIASEDGDVGWVLGEGIGEQGEELGG